MSLGPKSTLIGWVALVGALSCGGTGCDSTSQAATLSPSASAVAAPTSSAFGGDTDEALAFADPGDSENADVVVRAYQEAVKKAGRPDDWILLARAWIRKARDTSDPGFYLHAKACANIVLARTPDDPLALAILGQVELNDHKFKDALATSERILGLRPEEIPALGIESDALLELGRYDEAVKVTDKMLNLKPALPSYSRAAYLSWLHGDEQKARESGKLAVGAGRDPTDPEPRCFALVQTAAIFFHKGDYSGADKGYELTLKECPEYHYALAGRGRVALAMGNAKAAVDFLQRATEKSRLLEELWRLGDAKTAAGDAEGAERVYKDVVERGKLEDHRTLAQFLGVKNQDIDTAVRLARDEMKIRPGIYTEDALAWALYRKGELDEARKLSQSALRLGTPDASLEYHAGAILIAKGESDKGRALVDKALARNPKFDFTGAEEAAKLASLKP